MIYLVAYDITDDRRRGAVSIALSAYGARVQLSLFECDLPNPTLVQELKQRLRTLIDPVEDQIRLYPLTPTTTRTIEILGTRRLEERADFWIL